MGDHPNADVFVRLFSAFTTGDMAKAGDEFADNIVWYIPGKNSISGAYEGRDATLGLFGRLFEITGGTFKPEILDILANDKHVVAYLHATAKRNGRTLDQDYVIVMRIHESKIAEVREFWNDGAVWESFWL